MAILAAVSVAGLLNILYVALGLGLVIFIHELGHFAVAKWCGVKVERFSIGLGPVMCKLFTWGDTEYCLSWFPFGGYVKMLGQDDADPGQLTDTRIARDPRSYTSKSVPQRMAIISAGVFNNMVSAVAFFIIAFLLGVKYEPAIVDFVEPGGPAWKAGLRAGDEITRIDNRDDPKLWFIRLRMAVALSDGPMELRGIRDGKPFKTVVNPHMDSEAGDLFPEIGVSPTRDLVLFSPPDGPVEPGSAASRATPPLQGADRILKVDDTPINAFVDLQRAFAAKRSKTVTVTVQRAGESGPVEVESKIPPNPFRTVGLQMDMGKITAIQTGSPADGKLLVNDRITRIVTSQEDFEVGNDVDPLQLPDLFSDRAGEDVEVHFLREVEKGDPKPGKVTLTPERNRPGWIEHPIHVDDCPLSVPSIGIAFHVLHTVMKVDPDSSAGKLQDPIKKGNIVEQVEFLKKPAEGSATAQPADADGKPIEFGESKRNWAFTFQILQAMDHDRIRVKFKDRPEAVVLDIKPAKDWYRPVRGITPKRLQHTDRAASVGQAVAMGFSHTRDSVVEMYFMIRRMVSGSVSKRALGGPIAIFQTAFMFAEKGMPDLILFLGMLSVSLAVLNFLPIPVLDGGHFMFLCWEGIRGKPVSERVFITAQYVGLAMLLALMTWVIFLDIGRLIAP